MLPDVNTWLLQWDFVHPYSTKIFESIKCSFKSLTHAAAFMSDENCFQWVVTKWFYFKCHCHSCTRQINCDEASPIYLFLGSGLRDTSSSEMNQYIFFLGTAISPYFALAINLVSTLHFVSGWVQRWVHSQERTEASEPTCGACLHTNINTEQWQAEILGT